MAAATVDEVSFLNCFEDVISLLNVCEEEQNSISRSFIEYAINRLESAAKFVENIFPIDGHHSLITWVLLFMVV